MDLFSFHKDIKKIILAGNNNIDWVAAIKPDWFPDFVGDSVYFSTIGFNIIIIFVELG